MLIALASGAAEETDDLEPVIVCGDSLSMTEAERESVTGGWRVFDDRFAGGRGAGEDCDPDAALFARRGYERAEERMDDRADDRTVSRRQGARRSSSLSLAASRASPGGDARTTWRHRTRRDGWEHHLEGRMEGRSDEGETALTRRRAAWYQDGAGGRAGWTLAAGDLVRTDMPVWPAGLPRRLLPAGWAAARGTPERPQDFAAPLPQGVGAALALPHAEDKEHRSGESREGFRAYALRAWNPVDAGGAPPWRAAWNLRHAAAGAELMLPWTVGLHLTETRVARGADEALAERLAAVHLAAPDDLADLVVARGAGDPVTHPGTEPAPRAGWDGYLISTTLRAPPELMAALAPRATLELLMRGRTAGWASAWDPAVNPDKYFADDDTHDSTEKDDDHGTRAGARELRLSGKLPWQTGTVRQVFRFEAWHAADPVADTRRDGTRAIIDLSADDILFSLTGTQRTSRAASGSTSLYRYLEAEARTAGFPGWRGAAWRAWNAAGPTRHGLFVGAEPDFDAARLSAGLRVEAARNERLEALVLLGVRTQRAAGWQLAANATFPARHSGPGTLRDEARWSVTLTGTGR